MLVKNKSTKENREFWEAIEEVAKEVEKWPTWMLRDSFHPNGEPLGLDSDLQQPVQLEERTSKHQ